MANFSYKKTTNTTLKAVGFLDMENLTITCEDKELGEVERSVIALLSDFNHENISLSVSLKQEQELEEPNVDESLEGESESFDDDEFME